MKMNNDEEVVGMNETNTDVFVYTGEGRAVVTKDVVRVWVDPPSRRFPIVHFFAEKLRRGAV